MTEYGLAIEIDHAKNDSEEIWIMNVPVASVTFVQASIN